MPSPPPRRPRVLLAALVAAGAAVACATPPAPSGDDPIPEQGRSLENTQPVDAAALERCEELFNTLNAMPGGQAPTGLLAVAAASAEEEAEGCRAVFRAAARTKGARVIADAFADLMLLRAFELRMAQREGTDDIQQVCPDARQALDRMRRVHTTSATALDEGGLDADERTTLEQLRGTMTLQIEALEPFTLRGCKGGTFNPQLFVTTDDLALSAPMSEGGCHEIVVAFAAFDLEQAAPGAVDKLIQLLRDAAPACAAPLMPTGGQPPRSAHDLEKLGWLEILKGGPHLILTARALAGPTPADACASINAWLRLNDQRLPFLKELVASAQDAELRVEAATQLQTEYEAREHLLRVQRAACAL